MDPDLTEKHDELSAVSHSNSIEDRVGQRKVCFPVRYNILILGWLTGAIAYMLRVDLTLAIVAMVNQTYAENFKSNDSKDFHSFCQSPYNNSSNNNVSLSSGDIDWTPGQQGVVLSAFFMGYFFAQVPWGMIVQKWGGKNAVACGLLTSAVLSLVTPVAAETSFVLTVIIRGLMGITQGSVFPGLMSLIGKWVPVGERSTFTTIIGTGGSGGAIVATFLTAVFIEHDYLGGWSAPFYVFGGFGFVWFILWMIIVYNSPADHPRISRAELNYIQNSLNSANDHEKNMKIPWSSILKSISLWSLCVLLFCNSWLYYVLFTFMPTYMEVILGLDMKDNSMYTSLPIVTGIITTVLGGVIADWMINKGVRINTTRKFMTAIGILPESLIFVMVTFLGCRSKLVAAMFIMSRTFGGLSEAGMSVTIIDIAPKYSGVIYGIANCLSNFSGVLAPIVTGYITNVEETLDQWKKVFFLASGFNAFGFLVFFCFTKAEKAPWADGIIEIEEDKKHLVETTPTVVTDSKKYGSIVS